MRAVRMRHGASLHATTGNEDSAASARRPSSSPQLNAADAASARLSSTCSSDGPMDSKGATMAAVQRTTQQQQRSPLPATPSNEDVSQVGPNPPAAAAAAARVYGDADSPYHTMHTDPLADAIAHDAPMDFTARDDAQVVARLPLAFCDLLPVMDQQLLYRQRQDAHQSAVDAPPPRLTSSSRPPVSDFVCNRLPLAAGRVAGCKTKLRHPMAGGEVNGGHARSSSNTEELTLAEEQQLYRDRVAEEVLDHLFCPVNAPATPQHRQTRNETHYAMVEMCLSGLREVPSHSVEYGDILDRLVATADARSKGGEGGAATFPLTRTQAMGEDTTKEEDVYFSLPCYVRQLLLGRPDRCETYVGSTSRTTIPNGDGSDTRSGVASVVAGRSGVAALASAVPRASVVASTVRATLDALLPPRMMLYYLVSYEAAVAVQQQRRAAQAQQKELRQAVREHPDDQQSASELAHLTQLLAGTYASAPVGIVLVLLERTSDMQAPRDYQKGLEATIDEVLARCDARCCGRTLKLPTAGSLSPPMTAATAIAPRRPAEGKAGGEKAKLKSRSGATPTTTVLAREKNPVCTRTTKPLPTRPVALSSSGGSASVVATLNVVELNAERCLVQLDLLGEELLRQITIDLPERGVLLRRLLDEAHLSLDARGTLAKERVTATQQRLLDGQDDRETLAEAHTRLCSETGELRERLASLTARKAGLNSWVEERVSRVKVERNARADFAEQLRQRLTAHTEAIKAAQEAARQSAPV